MKENAQNLKVVKKHPTWIRWAHWINFPLLVLMIWSGVQIYWANDIYQPFFPDWFYQFFSLHHRLAFGMAIHFFVMWLFFINGILYFGFLIVSGEWRDMIPRKESYREALQVTLHDLGIVKESPPKKGKFNSAQKIAYTMVNLMGIGSIVTGVAIYKPVQLGWLTAVLGGYETARLLHFGLMLGFVFFFFIHVTQVIRAGWNNFRSMVSGLEVEDEKRK